MITRKEKDSHKTWKNDILSVEAIIDVSSVSKSSSGLEDTMARPRSGICIQAEYGAGLVESKRSNTSQGCI